MKTFSTFITENRKYMQLAEASVSPALQANKQVRRAAAIIPTMEEKEDAKEILAAVYAEEIYPLAVEVLDEFRSFIDKLLRPAKYRRMRNKPKIYTQIKKIDSLADKVIERRKPLLKIGDIVRGAILFDDQETMESFVDDLRRKHPRFVDDYEFKARGGQGEFGYYGSHHIDLILSGMIVELQITTKKLWDYKHVAHQIYTDYRSPQAKADAAKRYDDLPDSLKRLLGMYPKGDTERAAMALSREIFTRGNLPRYTHESVEQSDIEVLGRLCEDQSFIDEILSDFEYETQAHESRQFPRVPRKVSNAEYERRVQELIDNEGVSRSDAQSIVDAEIMQEGSKVNESRDNIIYYRLGSPGDYFVVEVPESKKEDFRRYLRNLGSFSMVNTSRMIELSREQSGNYPSISFKDFTESKHSGMVEIFDETLSANNVANHKAALRWAKGIVWDEVETTRRKMPSDAEHIGTVEGYIEVYFYPTGDYYFFVDGDA